MFANSPFDHMDDMALTRDYFWEYSMHGLLKNNVGIYSEEFQTEAEYRQYQEESAMFYVIRDNCYYYFKPITVKSFLSKKNLQRIQKLARYVTLFRKQMISKPSLIPLSRAYQTRNY